MRRTTLLVLGSLAALLIAAQFVPVSRTNPPVEAPLAAPADVAAILDRCCADCHSNQTRWPWYARVAPASWLVARDVKVGRENLDFSYWGLLDRREQRDLSREIVREVRAGTMPIKAYLLLHRRSRPSQAEARRLEEWFSSSEAAPGPAG